MLTLWILWAVLLPLSLKRYSRNSKDNRNHWKLRRNGCHVKNDYRRVLKVRWGEGEWTHKSSEPEKEEEIAQGMHTNQRSMTDSSLNRAREGLRPNRQVQLQEKGAGTTPDSFPNYPLNAQWTKRAVPILLFPTCAGSKSEGLALLLREPVVCSCLKGCAVLASRRMLWSYRRATGNNHGAGVHSESWNASLCKGEGSREIGLSLEKLEGVNKLHKEVIYLIL